MLFTLKAEAQIAISMSLEKETYLLYESFPVKVNIQNTGDQLINLENTADNVSKWISFLIYRADGSKVRAEKSISIKPIAIEPGASTAVLVDITPIYALRDSGQYTIQAVISVPGSKPFITDGLVISIGNGDAVWKEERLESGTKKVYSLIKFLGRNQVDLYVRVEEPSTNTIYSTQKLGRFTDFTKPIAKLDSAGSLHVVHTLSGQTYRYSIISADGSLVKQEDRQIEGARPELVAVGNGGIRFVGGTIFEEKKLRPKLSETQKGSL